MVKTGHTIKSEYRDDLGTHLTRVRRISNTQIHTTICSQAHLRPRPKERSSREPPPRGPRLSSTLQPLKPSSFRMASSASRGSSNSTKAAGGQEGKRL